MHSGQCVPSLECCKAYLVGTFLRQRKEYPDTRDVLRVKEGAQITDRLPLSTIPVACMLGGPQRRTLFIATTESQDPNDRTARGIIETIQVDVPGAGLP